MQSIDMKIIEVLAKNKELHKEIDKQYMKHKADIMSVLNNMSKSEKVKYEDIIGYVCVNNIDTDLIALKVIQLGYVSRNIINDLMVKGWPVLSSIIKASKGKEIDIFDLFIKHSNRHHLEYANIFAVIVFFVNLYKADPVAPEEEHEKIDGLTKMVTDNPQTFGKTTLYERYKDKVDDVMKKFIVVNGISGNDYAEWHMNCFGDIPASFELLNRIGRMELHNTCRSIKIGKHELKEIIALYYQGLDLNPEENETLEDYLKVAIKVRLMQKAYISIKKLYLDTTDVMNLNAYYNKEELREATATAKELKITNKKLENEINKLRKDYKKGLEQEISKLQADYDKLETNYCDLKNKLASSENIIDSMVSIPEEAELDTDVDLNLFNIWLVGGNKVEGVNWISGNDLHCDLAVLDDADYIFFNIVNSSHAARYRLFSHASFFHEIHYINGTNEKTVIDKIKSIVKRKFMEEHMI